ncbi:helix-turn-helix domain-containing protein [Lactobacillus helveticus]|uniref:helix-turn-helix domain-containing protein n=1 Tax=Lactobacillus helveticus TaxID=1587 RepID=UPI00197B4E14|nr:helix-turn-helix transcriptional regulator [Lactobacillus helveticus]MBN6048989.1 helix-turn-helix transcriptional regulator [Lactobacillus helveticus]
MKTWEDFKTNPRSFTNISEEEVNMIDTLAFLHATRIKMNISQTALSQKIGMSQSQIAKLENLDVQPTLKTLEKYASGLGLKIKLSVIPA